MTRDLRAPVLLLAVPFLLCPQDEGLPTITAVVDAAARYIEKYQAQLSSVVADEVYTQQVDGLAPNDPALPRSRRITGEMFFMTAPGRDDWMAIRDVVKVDGREVKDRAKVLEELKRLPVEQVVAAFKANNARFNLGRTFRNFNEPTLTLRVFNDDHRDRFDFALKRVERGKSGALAVLSFTEREGPSLIRDLTHGAVLSKGEFTIEPTSGRVQRAVLIAVSGPLRIELTTDYGLDSRLNIWVPTRFREEYEYGTPPDRMDSALEYEHISCEARYSNYRRFETSGRIKR